LFGAIAGAAFGSLVVLVDGSGSNESGPYPIAFSNTDITLKAGAVVATTVVGSILGGAIAAISTKNSPSGESMKNLMQ
jgi:hypothetical protein